MTTTARMIGELIDELSAEHADLLPWTSRLIELAGARSPELKQALEQCAPKLSHTLDNHITQEDTVLFPALAQEMGDSGLVDQFSDEHREILKMRDDLMTGIAAGTDVARLTDLTIRLSELLYSHMSREDMMLFPTARQALCG